MTESEDKVYYELTIQASSPTTEIWLGDSDGHLVQKSVGVLESSLMPGDYVVEFGLGNTTFPIHLHQPSRFTEEEMRAGPSCPRPLIDLGRQEE